MLTCDARIKKRNKFVEVKRFHARANYLTKYIN